MSEYLNRDDVLEVFNDIHPLDYNAQAYLAEIEELPVVETDKWISTAERQPEKSGLYLTYNPRGSFMTLHYSAKNKAWNAFDHEDEPKHALEVTHWLPLPEPPEEVQ